MRLIHTVRIGVLGVAFLTLGVAAFGQVVFDTLSLGAGYSEQVWYSMQNGAIHSQPRANWHIAFESGTFGTGIRLNSAAGTLAWAYPGDTSAWATFDTTGMATWAALYDSDTAWATGAFNRYQDGFDIGWGIYNPITHNIIGDSLFLLQLPNGDYRKFWVKSLIGGAYQIRYASLDNSVDHTHAIAKAPYTTKNFGYFDLISGTELDREPASTDWDLTFTSYTGFVPVPYTVTGALQNVGVSVAEAYPIADPMTENNFQAYPFSSWINTIGYDWKSFAGMWTLQDSLAYFVQTNQGAVWRLVFTGFGGSSNGQIILGKELLAATALDESSVAPSLLVYPNPAVDQVQVLLPEAMQEPTEWLLVDAMGRIAARQHWTGGRLARLSLSNIPSGFYSVQLMGDGGLLGSQSISVFHP